MAIRFLAFVLLATLAPAQQVPTATSAEPQAGVAEPTLPIVSDNACPANGRVVPHWKISKNTQMYSSWQDNRTQMAGLTPGEEVTVLAGAEIIREPDRVLATKPIPEISVQKDEVVLRYTQYGEGFADVWAKGVWHKQYYLAATSQNGTGCRHQCNSIVIKRGIRESWVKVQNSSGQTGWVPVGDGNFDDLCAD